MSDKQLRHRTREAGLSYTEALVAVVVLAAALVPMMQTLDAAFGGAVVGEAVGASRQRLATRMEQMLAQPFTALDAAALAAGGQNVPSSYSDPAGSPARMLVYLSRYDGDNVDGNANPFDGTDAGLIWVRVTIDNTADELTTLVAE